ncbi:MAG: polysaccharide pyruvyl transferase family protein [Planctomycetota bacterium]|nr:polysaccharide pyruvyl transferase family protein [Planctomycetota bacterium]
MAAGLLARGTGGVVVADHRRGAGPLAGWDARVSRAGVMRTRRWYRPESHAALGLSLSTPMNFGSSAALLRRASAFLDISGGDSFTSLYGAERFRAVTWPKRMALRMRKPLVLLPQTYGPFDDESRREAARLVRGAAACWARDARSFEILRELLGDRFDAERHRLGVDVAFLLDRRAPAEWTPPARQAGEPLAAVNVSGLIFNDPEKARTRYGFKADYAVLKRRVVERLVDEGARVLLVPHVVTPRGHYESDTAAAEAVAGSLPAAKRERVTIAPECGDPREAKHMIAQADWFCGTRMHATIAGLSSGVPTCSVAYSDKTLGVFETCGQGGEVFDPRRAETEEIVERVVDAFARREAMRSSLAARLPMVLAQAERQMDVIAEAALGRVRDGAGAGR